MYESIMREYISLKIISVSFVWVVLMMLADMRVLEIGGVVPNVLIAMGVAVMYVPLESKARWMLRCGWLASGVIIMSVWFPFLIKQIVVVGMWLVLVGIVKKYLTGNERIDVVIALCVALLGYWLIVGFMKEFEGVWKIAIKETVITMSIGYGLWAGLKHIHTQPNIS